MNIENLRISMNGVSTTYIVDFARENLVLLQILTVLQSVVDIPLLWPFFPK